MKKRRRSIRQRRVSTRRWHIPPPLVHGPETLEGGGILNEWENELGVVLWQAFRDAMLWATTVPEHRGEMFNPTGQDSSHMAIAPVESDIRLQSTLRVLNQLNTDSASVREEQVARACRQISEWAEEQGHLGTALAFAQNAALAAATDPGAAFWVATLAVRMNDHARAEVWFRRAIGLARQARDWRMYSHAFSGLGNLYMRRGNLRAAKRLHTRALRGARRGGMRREQAGALHDLFGVAVETSNPVEAERLARLALEAYGKRNPRVHVLAHDVAYFWMEQGYFERAKSVFQAVLPLIDRPVERLFVLADLARAAAGMGDAETADAAAEEVWRLAVMPEVETGSAPALLELARAYLSLRELDQARTAAALSIQCAIKYRESKVRFAAEAVLDSINTRLVEVTPAAPAVAIPTTIQPAAWQPSSGDELAADFVRTLEVMAGAAH